VKRFWNKRERPDYVNWVRENFKDSKLRVLLNLQYGLKQVNIPEDKKLEILGKFESQYDEFVMPNPVTKAAWMLRNGLIEAGYNITDKGVLGFYNLAQNTFTYKKSILMK